MKKYLVILVTFLITMSAYGQRNEVGISGSGMYYIGDLNPYYHFYFTRPGGGLYYRYNYRDYLSVRLFGNYGSVRAADSLLNYYPERKLHFRSQILEVGVVAEINYYKFRPGTIKHFFSPYLFLGINWFYFNPQAKYNDEWVDLQPMGTEGQGTTFYPDRKPYSLNSFAIPMGIGVKIALSETFVCHIEWGMRYTLTDYIDDVSTTYPDPLVLASQIDPIAPYLSDPNLLNHTELNSSNTDKWRGDPSTNDWYSVINVGLSFRFKNKTMKCEGMNPRYRDKRKDYEYNLKNKNKISF